MRRFHWILIIVGLVAIAMLATAVWAAGYSQDQKQTTKPQAMQPPMGQQQMGMQQQQMQQQQMTTQACMQYIQDWPMDQRESAQMMMQKYGPPHGATPMMLVWHNNGLWKKTVIYREAVPHNFPTPHMDYLEQTINYQVPADRFDELAAYDGSVIVYRTAGEMSARCDKEMANILALNLADDVITGDKNVAEAREAYANAIVAALNNRPAPLTQSFQFQVARGNTAAPDTAVIRPEMIGRAPGMMQR